VSPHHLWLKTRRPDDEHSYEEFSISTVAARLGKFAPPLPNPESVLGSYSYGYHFDAGLYAAYLRRYAESRGVRRIEGRIVDVRLHADSGFIDSVVLQDGRQVSGDLFLDCSGFTGLLIAGALGSGFEDWSRWLPCNRAFAVASEGPGAPVPYTRSTARDAGWQWRIPLQHRIGNGRVFCDAFISEDQAAQELLDNLDGKALTPPRLIRFVTGRRRESWKKNCVALGLASGFLEPLESTSLHLIEIGLGRLIELFPDRDFEPRLAEEYNRLMGRSFESIRDFIILHYHLSRRDEEFWRYCRSMAIPEALHHQLQLFRASGQVALYDAGAFAEPSWVSIFFGQRVWPRRHDPMAEVLHRDEVTWDLERRRDLVNRAARSLKTHADFISRYCAAAT
jgi:tryptophan halogenase